jgi:hypothetical protein
VVGIDWSDGTRSIISDGRGLDGIGLGWAVTPGMAVRSGRPLVVLGPAASMGRGRERVVAATDSLGPAKERRRHQDLGRVLGGATPDRHL